MSALSALSGETYSTRVSSGSGALSPSRSQPVERDEKRGERFSRAGRRGDERVAPLPDRLPSADLRTGGHTDFRTKPALHNRMEIGE